MINKYLKSYNKTRQSFLRLSVLFTVLIFCSQAKASVMNEIKTWERLFFQNEEIVQLVGKVYVINLLEPRASAIIQSNDNETKFLYIGDKITFSGKTYILKSINQDGVFFEDNEKKSYYMSLKNDLPQIPNKDNVFNSRKIKKKSLYQRPMYSLKKVPKDQIEEIFTETGLPLQASRLIVENISPARSRGGRPGWKIKAAPSILQKLGVNLRVGDIILAIDGVPAQKILQIKDLIKKRKEGQVFKVEIQRDGKLVLLEFSE